MSYQEKLKKLKESLAKNKPDMLITFGHGLFIAFLAFTFLSGLFFTVIPLLRNVYMHIIWHIIEPINRWVQAEPVTGNAIMFILKAAGVVFLIWLFRKWIMLIPLWIASQFESLDKKKKPIRKSIAKPTQEKLKAPPG